MSLTEVIFLDIATALIGQYKVRGISVGREDNDEGEGEGEDEDGRGVGSPKGTACDLRAKLLATPHVAFSNTDL